jgi:chromosome segregation ATPase
MEAAALAALTQRLQDQERRIEANHDSIHGLRGTSGDHEVKIAVISNDLEDIRDDLGEIKSQLAWLRRGMWTAAATFASFALALAGMLMHG